MSNGGYDYEMGIVLWNVIEPTTQGQVFVFNQMLGDLWEQLKIIHFQTMGSQWRRCVEQNTLCRQV
jgi:hypothetical protein